MEPKITTDEAKSIVSTKTAPRVTEEAIRAKIQEVRYFTHDKLTICVIEMKNGYCQVGKAAPASPDNYDPLVGQRYAYDDAFKGLWHLEGYLLCENLYNDRISP